jgi:hypothetical protein
VTTPQDIKDRIAYCIYAPPGGITTWYDGCIIPTYILLSFCEDSVISLFIADELVHIFVEDDTFQRVED